MPIFSVRMRLYAPYALGGDLAIVAALAVDSHGRRTATTTDDAFGRLFFDVLGGHRGFATSLAKVADPVPLAVAVALVLMATLIIRRLDLTALVALAPAAALLLGELALKPLVDKRLGGGLAFPSGHATACFGVSFVLAVVILSAERFSPLRAKLCAAAATVLALLVAVCIVISGDHYPTDVFAAGGVAFASVCAIGLAIDAVSGRRWRRREAGDA